MQHKHGGGASDRLGAQHERQITWWYEEKTRCWKGDCEENWLHGVYGRDHEGSLGKQSWGTDVEVQGEEKGESNDESVLLMLEKGSVLLNR